MKIKLIRSYRSKNGNVTFVYAVSGSKSQMEAYKVAQGEFYREDETTGQALWFTTRFVGKVAKLIITANGNIVPDMSEYDAAASLAAQYGGNLGTELAKAAAHKLLGGGVSNETGASTEDDVTPDPEETPTEPVTEKEPADLEKI